MLFKQRWQGNEKKKVYVLIISLILVLIIILGNLNDGNSSSSMFRIRPVINLKQDIEIISGEGTSISPYVVQNN